MPGRTWKLSGLLRSQPLKTYLRQDKTRNGIAAGCAQIIQSNTLRQRVCRQAAAVLTNASVFDLSTGPGTLRTPLLVCWPRCATCPWACAEASDICHIVTQGHITSFKQAPLPQQHLLQSSTFYVLLVVS